MHAMQTILLALAASLLFGCTSQNEAVPESGPAKPSYAEVETLTGSHTRVVWVQDMGDGRDTAAMGVKLRLMGFDSRDGQGERIILDGPANYAKPYITPKGDRVVYTDRTRNAVMVVNWDGSQPTMVASGVALTVWMDPASGHEWVYIGVNPAENRAPSRDRIERVLLDAPEVRELVWSQTPVTEDNVQISIDGRLAGGTFPWPHAGVAALPNRGWQRLARGCWPSISPDDQHLFWVFDGAHRNLTIQKYGTNHRWEVPINTAPGMDGHEVYHPRWSNHPRFLVVTGPYTVGRGGNRIRGGGPDVSLHIGRFSEDFRTVESWFRLTENEWAEFYPDVWLSSGLEKIHAWAEANRTTEPTEHADDPIPAAEPPPGGWPTTRGGLALLWEDSSKKSVVYDPETNRFRDFHVEPRGTARFTRDFGMDMSGGHFVAEGVDGLLSSLRKTGQITIEALVSTSTAEQSGPARIITYSSGPTSRNFTLGQSGDRLVLRLRTPRTGLNGVPPELDLGPLPVREFVHVVVGYARGLVHAYINGQLVFSSSAVQGDFSNWQQQQLLFGEERGLGRSWLGQLEGVALYNRLLEPMEIIRNYEAAMARLQDRTAVEPLVVKARVTDSLPPPTVEAIAPYQRALVVNRYQLEEVVDGEAPDAVFLAAHWAIMDGEQLESARREMGEVHLLHLEPFGNRPELEGEKISMDGADFLLPLYYDTRSGMLFSD